MDWFINFTLWIFTSVSLVFGVCTMADIDPNTKITFRRKKRKKDDKY
jgi:hypothetical protein